MARSREHLLREPGLEVEASYVAGCPVGWHLCDHDPAGSDEEACRSVRAECAEGGDQRVVLRRRIHGFAAAVVVLVPEVELAPGAQVVAEAEIRSPPLVAALQPAVV